MGRITFFTIFLGCILIGALLALVSCENMNSSPKSALQPRLSSPFLDGFSLELASSGVTSALWVGEKNGAHVEVHAYFNRSFSSAENYLSDKMFVINSLYREIHSPYPGALSNRIECDEEFKPQTVENPPLDYYRLYATERFTYGACSWDLIEYRVILYPLYCDNESTLFILELFMPPEENSILNEESLKSVMCSG